MRREGWHIYKDTTLAEAGSKLAMGAGFLVLLACVPEQTPGVGRVRLEPVARLAPGMDTLFSDLPTGIARSADGRYFVATGDGFFAQPVQVFDSSGKWLQAIGRLGSGPGEYMRASDVLPKGDSLLIVDGEARRLTTLNAELDVANVEQMPTWFSSPRLMPDGSLIGGVTRRDGDSSVVVFERWIPGSDSRPPRRGEGGRDYYPTDDWGLTFDGVIEVRDTVNGTLLASGRFDQPALLPVVGAPGLVASLADDADGWWRIAILRTKLPN